MRTAQHMNKYSFCSKSILSVQSRNDSFRRNIQVYCISLHFLSSSISVVRIHLVHVHLSGSGLYCNFNVHVIENGGCLQAHMFPPFIGIVLQYLSSCIHRRHSWPLLFQELTETLRTCSIECDDSCSDFCRCWMTRRCVQRFQYT